MWISVLDGCLSVYVCRTYTETVNEFYLEMSLPNLFLQKKKSGYKEKELNSKLLYMIYFNFTKT